jgi:hypothetical protein
VTFSQLLLLLLAAKTLSRNLFVEQEVSMPLLDPNCTLIKSSKTLKQM